MEEPRKNHLEKLEQDIYSRKHPREFRDERSQIQGEEIEVSSDWKEDKDIEELLRQERERREENRANLLKKILIGSAVFFLLSLGSAGFMFFAGGNLVSAGNIDIVVIGPPATAGGEELSLDVVIKNDNRASLEAVNLLVEYPEGTRVAGDVGTELLRERHSVGKVPARGEVRKAIKAVLFGEKETVREIKLTLEYRIEGSSATFFKEKIYPVAISSSPIIVSVKSPTEINSGQDIEFILEVTSNSAEVLQNILLEAKYPFGWSFKDAEPRPSLGNNLWKIGDLAPGDKRILKIKGAMVGQNDEERAFHFYTGIAQEKDSEKIGTVFSQLTQAVRISKPYISVDLALSGNMGSTFLAKPGDKIQANVVWANNIQSQILNGKIEIKISGDSFDKTSVITSTGGFYRSLDSTIIWDKNSNSELAALEPGDKGVVNFSFSTLSNIAGYNNESIKVTVTVSGNQINDSGKSEIVSTAIERIVKITSNVGLSARAVRSVGPFENSGPIPPRAEQETTYTVMWSLTNTLNTISQTKVSAQLPPYVKWAGFTDPANEKIEFRADTNTVIWDVGDLHSGTGLASSPRVAAFLITVLPSLNQVASTPMILQTSTLSGNDRFTESQVTTTAPPLTTRFASDPSFKQGDDVVAK